MRTTRQKTVLCQEDFDTMNTLSFLEGLSVKIIDAIHTVDNHANVMIGINTGVFIFVMTQLLAGEGFHFTLSVVAFFSVISVVCGLFAIRLPRFMGRVTRERSLLHTNRILEFGSAEAYADELQKMLVDDREIFRQHALEVYNLSKYYYTPKRKMLSYARLAFLCGVLASGVLLIIEKW